MDNSKRFLLIIGTAWMIDALDVALLSFIMPLLKTEWALNATQLGVVAAITSAGMMVGALLCGRLSDMFGRKKVLIGTLILFSLSNLALVFAPNVTWFIIIRFVTGIGLGGELPVAATIIADRYTGKKRSQMLVLSDSFWAYGWILASVIAFFVIPHFGWRVAVMLTVIFASYALVLRKHLPPDPLVKTKHTTQPFQELLFPKNKRPFIMISIVWLIVMLTYYGIFLWLPSVLVLRGFPIVNSIGYTLIMSIAQLPGYYLAAHLLSKISPKKLLITYLLGTIASSLVFILSTSLPMVLISGAFLSFFDLGAWGILIALTPSLFQTSIRGTAMGTAQSIGRFGATIGPFLVGWLLDMKTGIAFIFSLFVVLLLIAVIIINFGINEQAS
ncbi:MFS transporter [Leuconostoc gelidum subsp. gelidum]|uniref:MFS transporter n=1 Tax=Leuconostoc gelidum subsp. gelidum TaxID=1607839 RepID=A0ABS7V1U4_LEUGE|nr:MFS transporter [Leuconostoc gelidum]MBZ5964916.1 MFS transporter [Leuconostoc gelidum subsp. gelidum]MBZ5977377.1 MFS transporter [Leuconostoc gelidum subsp. gelidum]MBZ5999030.1 MFS transporter [Leuconostoc gelidum subsp. gelidum]